jgi:hypothetical protein
MSAYAINMDWGRRILPLNFCGNFKTWKQIMIFLVKSCDIRFPTFKKSLQYHTYCILHVHVEMETGPSIYLSRFHELHDIVDHADVSPYKPSLRGEGLLIFLNFLKF